MRYEINELMIKNGFIYDKDKKVENIVIPGNKTDGVDYNG
jgi:hypothetical protein